MKLKWEKPKLVDLADGLRAVGPCSPGSGQSLNTVCNPLGNADALACLANGQSASGNGCLVTGLSAV